MTMDICELKRKQLLEVAALRENLYQSPHLYWLFFEVTTNCNLHCRHCGSSCGSNGINMDLALIPKALKDLNPNDMMIAITGGEPMLHPQFYEIGHIIQDAGFSWGMTSNATLIDQTAAIKLKDAGMKTISVSLDGLESSHDLLRNKKGAWKAAWGGLRALQHAGFIPQVTTVVSQLNFKELPEMEKLLRQEGITSWRIVNMDPIGRARNQQNLLLSPTQFQALLDYIRRLHLTSDMDVTYGCAHYLGLEMERMVRDHYFFCGAGITVASIRANGDICACLDIENRPELVQGNLYKDQFLDVWLNRFSFFRQDRTERSGKCRNCPDRRLCGGDATHTWDFDKRLPLLCGKKMLSSGT